MVGARRWLWFDRGMAVAVILFSLLSALLNSLAAVLQRRATGQMASEELFRKRILRKAFESRLWIIGGLIQVVAFFALATALNHGSLVLVEPLQTTDLIFLLVVLRFGLRVRAGWREWGAMVLLSGGLGLLLAIADPHGGVPAIAFGHWLAAFIVIGGLVVAGAISMRALPPSRARAVIGGVTAGVHFSFSAVATKLVLNELHYGALHEFVSWQLYALIIVGVSSALSLQSMYGSGPLVIAEPALEIAESSMGVIIGLLLFREAVNHSIGAMALESLGGLLVVLGVILLASSKRLQDPHRVKTGKA